MKNERVLSRTVLRIAASTLILVGLPSVSQALTTLTFDDVNSLDEYASLGVTFSDNIGLWLGGNNSVVDDPSGGPFSIPYGICAGNCGGTTGSIFFEDAQTIVSIYALSGPGPDLINAGTRIDAYDGDGNLLASDLADTSVQFDLLTVTAAGIRRLDITSPVANNEAWDHLSLTAVPLPPAALLLLTAVAGLAGAGRRNG